MAQKKKKSFWVARFGNLRKSVSGTPPLTLLKLAGIDLAFLIIAVLIMIFAVAFAFYYFRSAGDTSFEAIKIIPQVQSGNVNQETVAKMDDIGDNLKNAMISFFASLLGAFLLMAALVGCWSYLGISLLMGRKRLLKSLLRHTVWFILWTLAWVLVYITIALLKMDVKYYLSLTLAAAFFATYLSVILAHVLFVRKGFGVVRAIFSIGLKKVVPVGLSFLICTAVFLSFNLGYFIMQLSFNVYLSVLSLVFILLFLSWSRSYLSIEIMEALEDV